MTAEPLSRQSTGDDYVPRDECRHPADDGSGRVCRRLCAPGRDYHGGGHWYADPDIPGDYVRHSTAHWIVTGKELSAAEFDQERHG